MDDTTAIELAFRAGHKAAIAQVSHDEGVSYDSPAKENAAWTRYDHHKDHSVTSTAFGPADHPALPLGLRRHPRWALRLEVSRTHTADGDVEAFDYHDMVTIYAHNSDDLIEVAAAVNVQPQAATLHALEEWTGTMWEERPLTLLVQPDADKPAAVRAAIDRVTHAALPAVGSKVTLTGRARAQVEIANGVVALIDGMGGDAGYVGVFYEIASIAGIGTAQAITPREVWEEQLRTKLETAFEVPKVGDGSGDAAIAIGGHAFDAGWRAAISYVKEHQVGHVLKRVFNEDQAIERAWSAYDPPEHIKALS